MIVSYQSPNTLGRQLADGAAESLRGKLKQAGLKKVVYPYLRQTIEI